MLGLDRAAVWVDLEVDAELVILGIKNISRTYSLKNFQEKPRHS